ncbi:MAG TPA: alpha/beta hydrolase [Bacteroidales bacterium]|nr:alpha/beta hydrolase [Bacteroidales bacterium]HPJ60445.1 alpha/beta hydrolase [Bacteroidales bacterium]HPR12286.1 alpha/beta hydrolase [Bacteroidales bacterium]HRW83862.1 alpha/beta hydrolase [Bacteroidales bacterium]
MNTKLSILIVSFILAFCPDIRSQVVSMSLWLEGVPGFRLSTTYAEKETLVEGLSTRYERVTNPALFPYLPPKEKSTGTAVLICPGGGYAALAFSHEGHAIAKWLNEYGIAGIILKYRLPSDMIMVDKSVGPLQDAQEALRTIRRNAAKWNIDPQKIGVMGFSAGGHLASTLSTHFDEKVYETKDNTSARPDFSILIYPVITMDSSFTHAGSRRNLIGQDPSPEQVIRFSNEKQINDGTPPAFIVHSADDKTVPVRNSMAYYENLVKYGIPSELHIFRKGGHGYGLAVNRETQAAWPDLCINWLKASGF